MHSFPKVFPNLLPKQREEPPEPNLLLDVRMLRSPAPGTAVVPWGAEAHGNAAASLTYGLCCWEMGF